DQPPPVGFAYALVDARITDHGQLVIRYGNVDEHAIVLRRAMHAEPLEDLDGPPERVAPAGVIEMHAHLRGGARLRLPHRARDRGEILLGEKGRDPLRMPSHHQSPLAPPPPKLPPPPPKSPPPPPPKPPAATTPPPPHPSTHPPPPRPARPRLMRGGKRHKNPPATTRKSKMPAMRPRPSAP